jgi:DNA-binding NarL/FixJ family response regulator
MPRTKPNRTDWISLIEAGYNLEGNERQWLDNLCDCADGLLDPSGLRYGCIVRYTPTTCQLGIVRVLKILEPLGRLFHASLDEPTIDLLYRQGHIVDTASNLVFPKYPNSMKLLEKMTSFFLGSTPDMFSVNCQTGTGECVIFSALLRERRKPTALERKRWPQVAAHLGAGLRLRTKLRELALSALPVDAVLDPHGRMHDGYGPATERDSREKLREAVQRIEQARTNAGRNEPDTALDNWEALVDGRWSLVDRFDRDGKRYVIAVTNDPAHPDPRGLTPRERQVAEFAGLGRSAKEVGYSLGVTSSTVTNCTSRIQEKLGLNSQAELVSFFSQSGIRRKLAEVAVAGERLLVGSYPLIDERWIKDLTSAECHVTAQIIAGSTNADIARSRDASEHTVANQVQAIFRKLQVRSRGELAARLQARR